MIPRWIANMVGIGRASVVDDSGELQIFQVTEGALGRGGSDRITDRIPRAGAFGFTSNPPIGAEVILLRRCADRSKSLIIATSHRPSRMKNLGAGDSAQYDVRGAYIWLTEIGIVIDGAGLPMTIQNVGTLTIEGDVHVTGDVVSRSGGAPVSLNTLRDDYHTHTHAGVSTGSGTSGPPTPAD